MKTNAYYRADTINHEPLAPEEEKALFRQYRAGDLAARDKLIVNNLRYAAQIALRLTAGQDQAHQDDAYSAANAGLLLALDAFDETKGTRFTTFANKFIVGEICSHFRNYDSISYPRRYRPERSESVECVAEEVDLAALADPNGFAPEQLDYEALHEAIEHLPPQKRELIELLFFGGMSVRAAAEMLKIARPWAHTLRNQALDELRIALGAIGVIKVRRDILEEAA